MCPESREQLPAMAHDPIALAARETIEVLVEEQREKPALVIIEVFQGEVRADPYQESQRLIITCKSLGQAKRIRENLKTPNVSFVVAHPHYLPFAPESAEGMIDSHEATHVAYGGESRYETVRKRLGQLAKEILVLTGIPNISRPVYFTEEEHRTMKDVFTEALKRRAEILDENGAIIFSVAAARPGKTSEKEYWAIHRQEGEIVLSEKEVRTIMAQIGLKIEKILAGMTPKTQAVAVESAAKALLMTILGGEKIEDLVIEKLIPLAHRGLQKVHEILPQGKAKEPAKPKKRKAPARATGIGSRFEVYPDRLIVVARKMKA